MNTEPARSSYKAENRAYYEAAYQLGYGIQYPEGHVIRVYNKVLQQELGLPRPGGSSLLDFGCGNGTHAAYFRSRGFDVYGLDVSPTAIQACRNTMPDLAEHFRVAAPDPLANPTFDVEFDVVLANQVLYFLSSSDMAAALTYLYATMKPGAVLIATMMGSRNYYYQYSSAAGDGIRKVVLPTGKMLHIQFTTDRDELVAKFAPYQPLHVGYYDAVISESEGSGFHFLYVGRKPAS